MSILIQNIGLKLLEQYRFFKEANIYSFSPSNKEGSVVLDGEFSLYLEEQGDGNCESVYVDLGKLDTEKVSSIVFCVCNYSKEFAFKYLESLTVCIYSGRTKKFCKIFRSKLPEAY